MTAEKDPKKAAAACFESIALDPENYRIGHTKASNDSNPQKKKYFCFLNFFFFFLS